MTISGSSREARRPRRPGRRRRRRQPAAPRGRRSGAGRPRHGHRAPRRCRRRAPSARFRTSPCRGRSGRSSAARIFASVAGPIPGTCRSRPAAAASRSSVGGRDRRGRDRARPSAAGRARPAARARRAPVAPRLELVELGEPARLDELLEARLDRAPMPRSSRTRPCERAPRRAPVSLGSARPRVGTRGRCSSSRRTGRAAPPGLRAARPAVALSGGAVTPVVSSTMATVVVPFRGTDPKQRLARSRSRPPGARRGDARRRPRGRRPVGEVLVVAPARIAAPPGVILVEDPGRGQGAAVGAGLDAAVAIGLPGAVPRRQRRPTVCRHARPARARRRRSRRRARARRAPRTARRTLSRFADERLFEPVYGPGSADRFARARRVDDARRSESHG